MLRDAKERIELRDVTGRLEKKCASCSEWKPLHDYHVDLSREDHRCPTCKTCRKEQRLRREEVAR